MINFCVSEYSAITKTTEISVAFLYQSATAAQHPTTEISVAHSNKY